MSLFLKTNKQKIFKYSTLLFSLVIFNSFLTYYLNVLYPMIGHDYAYHFPRMLDTYTHFKSNGLSIQWFTPSFGGGLPAYPNPQHLQFTLPQLLTFFVNPWGATLLSNIFFSSVGYFAFYRFGRDVLNTDWLLSALGASLFMVNGFFIEHLAAGHITFQTFPLIAILIYLLFSQRLRPLSAGIWIGITGTILIYSGSFYNIVIFIFSLSISIPLILFFKLEIKHLVIKSFLGSLFAGLFSAGKLYAVLSFMEQFPRIIARYDYYKYFKESVLGVLWQILGAMSLVPYYYLRGDDPEIIIKNLEIMARFSNIWETDISFSPVLIFLCGYGLIWMLVRLKRFINPQHILIQSLILVFIFFGVWLTFEFSTGLGLLFESLNGLPVIRSMHVNQRNVAAFILPAAIFATIISTSIFSSFKQKMRTFWVGLLNLLVFIFLGAYLLLPLDLQGRNFDVAPTTAVYKNIQNGDILPVSELQLSADYVASLNGASSVYPYEAIFGYLLEKFNTQLTEGSPFEITEGYYNFTNPIGLVFPEESGVEPFERFKIEDRSMLDDFLNRKQPDWKIPNIQLFLNGLSLFTLIGCIGYLVFLPINKSLQSRNR